MDKDADQQASLSAKRRALLALMGSAALPAPGLAQFADVSLLAGRTLCVITPEQTEGPYFVDHRLQRSDIRSDGAGGMKPGVPLRLKLNVYSLGVAGCVPLRDAMVDVWHCDAQGVYSSVESLYLPRKRASNNTGNPFLRGYQITDEKGGVEFITIYPGEYPGRAVHIHFKVRTKPHEGRGDELVSQLYFDEAVTGKVHAEQPYAARGRRSLKNEEDALFKHANGKALTLSLKEAEQGYAASFDIALKIR